MRQEKDRKLGVFVLGILGIHFTLLFLSIGWFDICSCGCNMSWGMVYRAIACGIWCLVACVIGVFLLVQATSSSTAKRLRICAVVIISSSVFGLAFLRAIASDLVRFIEDPYAWQVIADTIMLIV